VNDDEIITKAKEILDLRARHGPGFSHPRDAADFLTLQLSQLPYEAFCCIYLDNRHRMIAFEPLFRGSISGCSVYAREVARECIRLNAAAAIFAHNHPSGCAEPSNSDELITGRLKEALALIDVRVLDHFVVGGGHAISLAERGLL
jgi:DNA repair protein RadC